MKSLLTKWGNRPVFFLVALFLFAFNLFCSAQKKDSTAFKVLYPNIPKFSISNYTIYQKSLHLGYERVLNSSHSIYIFGGYNEFPKILNLNLTGTVLSGGSSKSGYSIGAEFRFYLPKESKYGAPHGVFLAPYVSYYNFSSNHSLKHTDSSGTQSAGLAIRTNFFNIGCELGYQFVIAKRFVVDCELFGPSLTYYKFQADLQGQINGAGETLQAIIDALKERLPLLNDLSNGKKYYSSGSASQKFPFIGFRYAVSIGYAF
jgi:Protein of unknown function (DUF3575)